MATIVAKYYDRNDRDCYHHDRPRIDDRYRHDRPHIDDRFRHDRPRTDDRGDRGRGGHHRDCESGGNHRAPKSGIVMPSDHMAAGRDPRDPQAPMEEIEYDEEQSACHNEYFDSRRPRSGWNSFKLLKVRSGKWRHISFTFRTSN